MSLKKEQAKIIGKNKFKTNIYQLENGNRYLEGLEANVESKEDLPDSFLTKAEFNNKYPIITKELIDEIEMVIEDKSIINKLASNSPFKSNYFAQNPEKVLGEIVTHNPNTGKELTDAYGKPRPEVRGTMKNVAEGINVPPVKRYEHFVPTKVKKIAAVVKPVSKSASRIKKAIAKTKTENRQKIKTNYTCDEGLQCLGDTIIKYNTNVEYKDENGKVQYYTISKAEIKVYVTYQVNRGLFDLDIIRNNDWGNYYVENPDYQAWYQKGLVAYDGNNWIPESLFYAGNIYKNGDRLERNRQAIITEIDEVGFQEQMDKMITARPKMLKITRDETQKLILSPFHKIWKDIKLTELADGQELDKDEAITSIFYYKFLRSLPESRLIDGKKRTTPADIYYKWILKKRFDKDTPKTVRIARLRNAQVIGTKLFDEFLLEKLREIDKGIIAKLWNEKNNNFRSAAYHKIPIGFNISTKFKGGELRIRPAQREGVAFMNNRGTGIVAYDVGVGKTMTSILGMADGFSKGLFKRPLVVVPQKVYYKWIAEINGVFAKKNMTIEKGGKKIKVKKGTLLAEGILPNIPVNDYFNLGVNHIDKVKDDLGIAFTVGEYSITMVTFEGLVKIGFKAESEGTLVDNIKAILSQGESGRGAAKVEQTAEGWIDKALTGTVVDIEDMGIDAILVDEAHNFRNLFMEIKADVDEEGEREDRRFNSSSGSQPSGRAVSLFMLNTYIHSKHKNRNTFGLTATPFTNRPQEIYSMLAHFDYEGLKDYDVFNLNQFATNFIDETVESVWTAQERLAMKAVVRGYNNLPTLQSMVFRAIAYKTGEEANIERPEKIILPLIKDDKGVPLTLDFVADTKLPPSAMQEDFFKEIRSFARDAIWRWGTAGYKFIPYTNKIMGQALIALNAARAVTFSPYALKTKTFAGYNPNEVSTEDFIKNSPKIKYICECIRSVKAYHEDNNSPVSGQIIYSDRGKDWFGHIKDYLVESVGYLADEVAIFDGSTAKREKLKEDFLSNKIKVLIGTSKIREGVDLQNHCSVIYVGYLDWNPTDLHQLWGRGWRFGNKFSHIRIVTPLIENSSDIFTWQKMSEKMSRLNSIWTVSNNTKMFNEADLNAEELKKGLMNDPIEIAAFEIKEEKEGYGTQLVLLNADIEELSDAKKLKARFIEDTYELQAIAEEAKNNPQNMNWEVTKEDVEKLQGLKFTDKNDMTQVYKMVRRYADLKSYSMRQMYKVKLEQHRKYRDKVKRIEETILLKNRLTIDDDFEPLLERFREEASEVNNKITELSSKAYEEAKIQSIIDQKEKDEASRKPVAGRVNDFARLNYLLDCKNRVHTCDIYGRVQEIETGKVVELKPQELIDFDVPVAYKMSTALRQMMHPNQLKVVRKWSEELKQDTLAPLDEMAKIIPSKKQSRTQMEKLANKYGGSPSDYYIVYAHYFNASTDYFVMEWVRKEGWLFSYVILNGDVQNAELGDGQLEELRKDYGAFGKNMELDFHYEPRYLAEAKYKYDSDWYEKPKVTLRQAFGDGVETRAVFGSIATLDKGKKTNDVQVDKEVLLAELVEQFMYKWVELNPKFNIQKNWPKTWTPYLNSLDEESSIDKIEYDLETVKKTKTKEDLDLFIKQSISNYHVQEENDYTEQLNNLLAKLKISSSKSLKKKVKKDKGINKAKQIKIAKAKAKARLRLRNRKAA